ncbi:Aste57867_23165 [Aphanomyces stellatus]|uniref:Aste57867_23165 protein n=1 Tax=Aphanomyces stellatus TaxID=120398 RepID=A0A485LRN8_9STRA|nr:hypothetical protein As57867_023094 [Aphanomyces stellatus]VFT99813.1 Aste57867_23165 [Aphanomyces stellatus]
MPYLGDLSHAVVTAALLPCVMIHTVFFESSWKRSAQVSPPLPPSALEATALLLSSPAPVDDEPVKEMPLPPAATPLSRACLHDVAIIGSGVFGSVTVVQHNISGEYFALKAIAKAAIPSVKLARQAVVERDIMEAVAHPFVATCCGSFQDDANIYLVSEFIQGGELYSYLFGGAAPRHVSAADLRFYAANIIKALQGLHAHGVLYRDLKMENMVLDAQGYIKLVDMGFAKMMVLADDVGTDRRAKTVCGTPEYMAPEMLLGKGYGQAVDYWALGVVLYEIATGGESLFYRNDGSQSKMTARIKAVATDGLPTSAAFAKVDATLRSFITDLLAYDPAKRLGCTADGFRAIESHPFFDGMDWAALMEKRLPAPFVPTLDGPADTRHFPGAPTFESAVEEPLFEPGCETEIDPKIALVFEGF